MTAVGPERFEQIRQISIVRNVTVAELRVLPSIEVQWIIKDIDVCIHLPRDHANGAVEHPRCVVILVHSGRWSLGSME